MGSFGPEQLGKIIIFTGAILIIIGVIFLLGSKIGLFKLPGDITLEGKNWKVFFPLATSIVISLFLTLLLWLINYFRK